MNKKKLIITGSLLAVIVGGIAVYFLFLQPNRDTQAVESAFTINAEELVSNCLTNLEETNNKLLSEDGESEVFVVTGVINSIEKNQNGQATVYLFAGKGNPLVRSTFLIDSDVSNLKKGDNIKVKGVFRSCAEIDEDLDLLEDAIIDQCNLVN